MIVLTSGSPVRLIGSVVSLLLLCLAGGCGSQNSTGAESQPKINWSEQVQVNGETWQQLESMDESMKDQLSQFFRQKPSLSENPVISGQPVLYQNSGGAVRFVWMSTLGETQKWCCVQKNGRKWSLEDGSGELFQN